MVTELELNEKLAVGDVAGLLTELELLESGLINGDIEADLGFGDKLAASCAVEDGPLLFSESVGAEEVKVFDVVVASLDATPSFAPGEVDGGVVVEADVLVAVAVVLFFVLLFELGGGRLTGEEGVDDAVRSGAEAADCCGVSAPSVGEVGRPFLDPCRCCCCCFFLTGLSVIFSSY